MSQPTQYVTIVCLCLVASIALQAEDAPKVSISAEAVRAPVDTQLICRTEAKGVQVYKSLLGNDGKLAWVFEGPLANLMTDGRPAGFHFDGPTWIANDGSAVTKRDGNDAIVKFPASNAKADIPWLRIAVKGEVGHPGILSNVTFVLRVDTKGGQPPADAPARAGIRIGVDYTATYLFYGK